MKNKFISSQLSNRNKKVVQNLHCVVQVAVLVEEPEDAVVWLGVDALLFKGRDLVVLVREDVQLEHFKEGVAVLGSELNRKVEVIFRVHKLAIAIVSIVGHREPGAFTPDLAALGDLSQSLVESAEGLIELLLCLGPGVLQLDQGGPESARCEVNGQRLVH